MNPTILTRAALLFTIVLASSVPAMPQTRQLPPFVLGLGGGYDIASGSLIGSTDNGRGYDQSATMRQASLSFMFPKLFTDGWGLTTALSYGDIELTAKGTGGRTVYVGGAPTTGSTLHDYHLQMRVALFELMTHIHIGGNARLELGPMTGIGFFPEYQEREEVLSPIGATFSDGAVVRHDSSSATDEGMFISGFGIRAGYEIPFFGGLALMPVVNLRALVGYSGDGDGIVVAGTAGLGLSLLSGRTGGIPQEIVPVAPAPLGHSDTTRRGDSTARPGLQARLDLYSLDSAGRRSDTLVVSMRRTLRRIEVPLETTIRFEPSSAALPERAIAGRGDAESFSEDDLVAMRPTEIRRRSLEVVAGRMRHESALRISVAGSRRSDEPAWFADARSRSVRSYLQSVWGIDSSRVAIDKGSIARKGHAPGVTIAASKATALAPVVSEWIEQEVVAAPVGVQPTIVAEQGVQSWRVSVMQGSREVGVVRNTDDDSARQIDIGMALRRLTRSETGHALGAELVVEDSSGAVTVARDRMEIVVDEGRPIVAETPADSFFGEYVVALADTAGAGRTIERLVNTLPVNARITVSAPIGRDSEAAVCERRLRSLAAANGRVFASIEMAPARADEDLNGSLLLISVRGTLSE